MSLFFENKLDENCLDLEAFNKRDWPGDRIIKHLMRLSAENKCPEELRLHPQDWKEWCDQMGSKRPERVFGNRCYPLVIEGDESDPLLKKETEGV